MKTLKPTKSPSPALIIALCFILFTSIVGLSEPLQTNQTLQTGKEGSSGLRFAQSVTGKVVGITDGDTITLLVPTNTQIMVRLAEIDAPEKHQAYGNKAKQALSDKIFGKEVTAIIIDVDRYGRSVAQIYFGVKLERWINKEMVAEGWAWQYPQYSKSKTLYEAEQKAREQKLGLWADKNPIPPWEYRKPTQVKPDDEEKIQPLIKVKW
jgi:endonuclease YncB( thermonuclease family)